MIGTDTQRTWLASHNVAWFADLFTVTLGDGTVYYWTTCDTSLLVGGHSYLANGAILSRSPLRRATKLEIDTLTVKLGGTVLVGGKTIALLVSQGWLDGARLKLDHLVMPAPGDVSLGTIPMFEGRVADSPTIEPMSVTLNVKSELEALNQTIPRFLYQASCGHTLYDANCAVTKSPVTTTVQASPTPTASSFGRASSSINYALGFVEFTSGPNSGVRRSITGDASNVITVTPALPSAPVPGDGIKLYKGCDLTRNTCQTVHNNAVRNRSFTHIPKPSDAG